MTEAEWLACRTSRKLLDFLHGRLTERKLRLIGCACCRVAWPQLSLAELRTAVAVAERVADGIATDAEIDEGFRAANRARDLATGTIAGIPRRYKRREARRMAWAVYELVLPLDPDFEDYLDMVHGCVFHALEYLAEVRDQPSPERLRQARVIRDVVGNPFRPVACDPQWRTSTVLALAGSIYADRAYDRLPILADALMDAGCDSADVLDHCRSDGPHVRGCWVVDLVLGKT